MEYIKWILLSEESLKKKEHLLSDFSSIANDGEHLFLGLFAISTFLGEMSAQIFCPFSFKLGKWKLKHCTSIKVVKF